jgi:hypothetical protein
MVKSPHDSVTYSWKDIEHGAANQGGAIRSCVLKEPSAGFAEPETLLWGGFVGGGVHHAESFLFVLQSTVYLTMKRELRCLRKVVQCGTIALHSRTFQRALQSG